MKILKLIFGFGLLCLFVFILTGMTFAQTINDAEYFFDKDPGVGKGKSIPVTVGDSVLQNTSIPTTGLPAGFHHLFIRIKDNKEVWSLYEGRTCYILPTVAAPTPPIVAAEYFIDKDPGVGKGKTITVTEGDSVVQSPDISTTGLSSGFHQLFIRVKDNNGKWSLYEGRTCYILPTVAATPLIVTAEYFFDKDPGVGKGKSIPVTTGDSVVQSPDISTTGLSFGFHQLFIRVKDYNGIWSLYEGRTCYVLPTAAATPLIMASEYFFDKDPGVGMGKSISVTEGDSVLQSPDISTTGLSFGFHQLFIRVKDNKGKWSLYEGRTCYILPTAAATPLIVAAEYFFDKDPGVGKGKSISVTEGDSVLQSSGISTTGLSLGFHQLFIRVKDNDGKWSLYEGRTCYVLPTASAVAPPIVASEYYFDIDHGVGSGTALSVVPGDSIIMSASLPTSLPIGTHILSLRVKNSGGVWSLSESRPFTVCKFYFVTQSLSICQGQSVMVGTHTHTVSGTYYDTLTAVNSCDSVVTTHLTVNSCYSISGYVKYDNKDSTVMTNTTVNLANSGDTIIGNTTTDVTGHYIFANLNNGTYKLSCSTAKAWGGVNPVDALVVNRTYIKLSKLTDPLEILAGDVNNDSKINPVDALTINRRYIVLIHNFKKPDWIFSDPTVIIDGSDIIKNITAICTGDVNASYNPPARITLSPLNTIGFMNISHSPNPGPLDIPVYLNDNVELGAFGIKFKVQSLNFKVLGIKSDIEGFIYNVTDDGVNIAWAADYEGYSITPDKPLFYITAIINKSDNLTSEDLISINSESGIADFDANLISSDKLFMPELLVSGQQSDESFNAYSNDNMLIINYNNTENSQATLSIFDILGQNVKDNIAISNGNYRMNLGLAPGAYLLRLVTNDKVYVKKVYLQ